MKKKIYATALIALLAAAVNGHAAPAREESEAVPVMETVVVTASRYAGRIKDLPVHVSVIERRDIEQATARNVPELLRTQTGVQVRDVGGNGRTYRVDIRGFGETAQSNVLVLVDGRRINQADLSGTDWSLIPLERVERIEIVRGGRGGVLYGDNASGGVINIITRGGEGPAVEWRVAGGSYDTLRSSVHLGGRRAGLEYGFSAAYQTTAGYRDHSDSQGSDLGLNLNHDVNDHLGLYLKSGYHTDNTDLPGALKQSDLAAGIKRTASLNPDDFADTDDYYVAGGSEFHFGSASLVSLEASFRERRVFSFASFAGGTFEADTEIDTIALAPQFVVREAVLGLPNQLTLGYDYSRSEEDIHNILFIGVPDKKFFNLEKENHALYLLEEIRPMESLALSAGIRKDWVDFSFFPANGPAAADMDELAYTLGGNYTLSASTQAYISYNRSFRYPVLDELFSFMTNTIMTDMKNQTSDDYEIGLRHAFTPGCSGSVNLFRIDTDDEIFFNPAAGNQNLDGTTRRQGGELSLSGQFGPWRAGGGYTYTDAIIEKGQFAGRQVPGVPVHQAVLEAGYDFARGWSVGVNGKYVGERPFESDFANAFDDQDDYVVLNAGVRYHTARMDAFVNVNNLTNTKYAEFGVLGGFPTEPAFYPSPEINVMAGIKVAY